MRCGFTANSSVEEGQRQWFVSFLLLVSFYFMMSFGYGHVARMDDHGQEPGFAAAVLPMIFRGGVPRETP